MTIQPSTAPNHLALGAAGELLVAAQFALLGYQVYRPLADDRGVDLIVDVGAGKHVMVQVKAIRGDTVFMEKSKFPLLPWVALALVRFSELDPAPDSFLIPATEWLNMRDPLGEYDYAAGKSKPEFVVKIRKKWRDELAEWAWSSDHVARVLGSAH